MKRKFVLALINECQSDRVGAYICFLTSAYRLGILGLENDETLLGRESPMISLFLILIHGR
jgi:hypothetical protein